MILTSKPIKAEAGLKSGLVDAVVAPEKLLETAKSWALDMATQQRHRPESLYRCGAMLLRQVRVSVALDSHA